MGASTFGIIGGEPFVRSDMVELMAAIKNKNMNGSITTNGTLLDQERVKKIVDMNWDLIRISIDGIEDTHDNLRGKKGSFSKLMNTLDLFDEYGGSKPTIEINTVLNKENFDEIPELIELAHNYDIKRIFLLPVIEFNQEAREIKLKGNKNIEKPLKKAERICNKYGIENNIEEVTRDELYSKSNETDEIIEDQVIPCFVPWYSISINSKGIATPCSQFEDKFGVDVRENSLEEVWKSGAFRRLREKISSKDLPKTCSKCCAPLLKENEEIRKNLDNKTERNLAERY